MLTSPDMATNLPVVAARDPQLTLQQAQAFMTAMVGERNKAIAGRASCGIEAEWLEDEEHYQGIDEHNRKFQRTWLASIKRGVSVPSETTEGNRSTVFLNITRPYCDAGAARLADMLLPVDDPCFAIKPTPLPELDASEMAALERAGIDWQSQQKEIMAQAKRNADAMFDEISDHLTECGWHGEVRVVIEDSARIGTGVLKGPVPFVKTIRRWTMVEGVSTLDITKEIKPASKRIDPWNFFPDPACGEDIHNGNYTWEREYITAKQLRDLGEIDPMTGKSIIAGYFPEAITKCLLEGPQKPTNRQTGDGTTIPNDDQFELWTRYGVVKKDDASASGLDINDQTPMVDAMALMVNDRFIKLSLNVNETGEYPYDVLAWQRRPGVPYGMGIGRHIRTPQRMLNAATRAMMDNAGTLAGFQLVIGNGVVPEDGKFEIRGRKLWRAGPEVIDIQKSFWAYVPPSMVPVFLEIIEFARSIAEQTTGMPMLLQGQSAPTGGQGQDTLGGMQMLQNNATGVLRRLAKRFDDYLTDPHIRRYYDWLMQYSKREEIKGDYQVDVRASSALIERDSQKQFMNLSMGYAADPKFGINPYNLFRELAKTERVDFEAIQYVEEDYEKRIGTPSELEQAKTSLANAQTENQRASAERQLAQALLARVEAIFSGINTANLAAQNPLIAPAADETLLSAGFKDANAAPIVGPVNGVPPQPMPSNTSPNFPPQPPMPNEMPDAAPAPTEEPPQLPQPDVGAQAGIEGGQP